MLSVAGPLGPKGFVSHAIEVRRRLWYPPNARPDTGIDLRRAVGRAFQGMIPPAPPRLVVRNHPWKWIPELYDFNEDLRRLCGVVGDPTPAPIPPKVQKIIAAVCRFYGVRLLHLKSQRRSTRLVRPRHVAMYLAREMTSRSLPEIGFALCRDHTSVIHGAKKIARLIETDAALAAEVAQIAALFTASTTTEETSNDHPVPAHPPVQ